jgi:hypothetical protein
MYIDRSVANVKQWNHVVDWPLEEDEMLKVIL